MPLNKILTSSMLAVLLTPLLIGCGESGETNPDSSAPAAATNGPLLSKVFYNDMLADEYTYDANGTPLTHTHYHPVTGEMSSLLTVVELDDAGRVIEASEESNGETSRVVHSFDAQGRRTSIVRFAADGAETSRSTYSHAGDVITQTIELAGRDERQIIYTLNDNGNVVSQRWISGSEDQTHTFADFDSSPNPRTLTASMHGEYPLWRNNYRTDTTYAGCEFTSVHQYNDAGLLIRTDSTGCVGPGGSPVEHHYRYEYVER